MTKITDVALETLGEITAQNQQENGQKISRSRHNCK